ncbi:uncharacterized protein IL334_007948 [Kwoniella shivajii]|uniref:DH domain-containing protein n=1 Tax=Kwoniella shivajii TaxID=564305 RepID=A0ABZ1DBX9_9TREE|nr:hypothetical protein IL334_007948 [Kwoniella shivajii]
MSVTSTPPKSTSKLPPDSSPSGSYRRSPSVSETIQKYESRNTPPTERRPSVPTPRRSGIPSLVGSNPSGSPRSTSIAGPSRNGSMSAVKTDTSRRASGAGLRSPGKVQETRRVLAASPSSIPRPSISNTSSSSSVPRSSSASRQADRSPSHTKTTSKPFPNSSIPRSTSDTFYISPRSVAGPSRLTPNETSSSQASPVKPPLRRKPPKADLTNTFPPVRKKASLSSLSSMHAGEGEDRGDQTTPVAAAMTRADKESSHKDAGSGSSHGSPNKHVGIIIPTRRSSNNPSTPSSPQSAGPHPISPRTTSRELPSPTMPNPRRMSRNLGDTGPVIDSRRSLDGLVRNSLAGQAPLTTGLHRTSSSTSQAISRSSSSPSPKGHTTDGRAADSPRRSPNLVIQTPPSFLNSRLSSASTIVQPSPPVPAKSPLRGLSRENSEQPRTQTIRSASGELAQATTPTIQSRLEEEHSSKPFQDLNRSTNFTVPSVYSQDSAPPTATSWAHDSRSSRSSSLPRLSVTDKALPYTPDDPLATLSTPDHPTSPAKSPSLPFLRSHPSVHSPSILPNLNGERPLRPLLPTSPSIVMSKRSHLIREIASSERSYAKDLALVRDAYMYRFLRPISQSSTVDSVSPGSASDASRRSSTYTYQTAETKRSSGHDSANWIYPGNGTTTPLPKSPSDGYNLGYFSTPGSSGSSLQKTPQPSFKHHKRSSSSIPSMPPPVGKPLSPADLKTIFLNLDQLASASEELATAFERAMGEEGVMGRDGEAGGDTFGHVFVSISDPAYNAHLKECWLSIKDHTHGWNLDSMLIKPVQRITKYPLLFEDLLSSTTPVHPDYFAIRTAAQMSKAIAMEIDDAKRRKDVVSNAISSNKTTTLNTSPKETKQSSSKLLGLKRFRKDKDTSSVLSNKSVSSTELSVPPVIPESSLSALKDLATKVDELDQCVKRVGKEVILWTAGAREVLNAQDGMMRTWLRVVQLEPTDPTDRRMLEFRKIIDGIVQDAWKELIMPIFAKLLESTSNPRKVIAKRDSRFIDYGRYHTLRASKKTIDKGVTQSAAEFVALHTQLVDELPAFLEGCLRILDIALVGFAKAQAKYHLGIKEQLAVFEEAWVQLPLSPKVEKTPTDTATYRGIIKSWHDTWMPYAEAMDHFSCTRPGSRPGSRSNSPMFGHSLRHSASVTSPTSLSGSRPSSPAQSGRFRSSSLRSQTTPSVITVTSPKDPQSSRFSLLRRSNSKTNVPKSAGPPLSPQHSGLKPSSASMISDTSSRLSWGLPRISADPTKPMFDGLGLSPTKPTTMIAADHARATSDPSPSNIYSVDLNSSQVSLASTHTPQPVGLGLGDVSTLTNQAKHPFARIPTSPKVRQRSDEVDAAEGWRNEQVIYQCACVADFDPPELGDRKYRGLKFLPMVLGDLIDFLEPLRD